MKTAADRLIIINPKRKQIRRENRQSWYSFYAGFSFQFAEQVVSSARLHRAALVVDPWNGTGTSTLAGASLGSAVRGFDLNPAMVVVARAKLLDDCDLRSVNKALLLFRKSICSPSYVSEDDPLLVWFSVDAVREIRAIEQAFRRASGVVPVANGDGHGRMPGRIAFFYVALFRVVRRLLLPFMSSNPTWVRRPKAERERISLARRTGFDMFEAVCSQMLSGAALEGASTRLGDSRIHLASAESLPLSSASVDLILTSPPYCTRIDYAVATMPELAVLGFGGDEFRSLRHSLTGTLTVNGLVPHISPGWGKTCERFLKRLRNHPSKASGTYYFKTHLQYFGSIERSLSEVCRVMRHGSQCVLVVQDSYYKNVRNDLPSIFTEMAELKGLALTRRQDFKLSRTMARINPRAKKYREQRTGVESVLCFSKP